MPSGRGFGKNMKIEWKIDAKIEAVWWLKTKFRIILFAYFTLLPFLKNVRKSMPNESPKVMFFGPKTDLQRPRVHWFCNFGRFLRMRKIIDFLMRLQWSKKSEKSAQVATSSRYKAKDSTSRWRFSGTRVPGSRPFRVRRPTGKELKGNKRQETSLKRDLTRL